MQDNPAPTCQVISAAGTCNRAVNPRRRHNVYGIHTSKIEAVDGSLRNYKQNGRPSGFPRRRRPRLLHCGNPGTIGGGLRGCCKRIRQLCKALNANYFPWSAFPRDLVFDKEVWSSNLGEDRKQELIDLYRDFREHFAYPEYAEALLRVVIRRCQFYGAEEVISASLALGVMLGDASRHQDVLKTFSDLTMKHERDPRTWAALPSALFHLARYEQSLQALKNARESILKHYREESGSHMPEVVHNIANLLIVFSRYDETQAEIDRLSSEDQSHSFIRALRGRLLLLPRPISKRTGASRGSLRCVVWRCFRRWLST